ncbi:MAG TPA: ABC-three component system middle component 6 [Parapedobacter sp.]|uniref:ABC-three component system middle component 6 n=1 Tax=Parapedobacter sp. TaxID=1958893 RepID=UPI002CF2AE62|nr:ABC-three component system middle component 6 [Parapedobacter sp.]HWK57309.1 ABC-three component system middle component 6 [Parapedobacter sp.]
MIVNKNTNPERDLYYLGGKVIELLDNSEKTEFDYLELYNSMHTAHGISINLFTLVLDWLFILGVLKNGKKGAVEKCF